MNCETITQLLATSNDVVGKCITPNLLVVVVSFKAHVNDISTRHCFRNKAESKQTTVHNIGLSIALRISKIKKRLVGLYSILIKH